MPDKKGGSGSDRREDQTENTRQQQREIEDLQHQVRILTLSMGSITGYEGIVNLIDNGLANIAAQLEPLRDLRPLRTGEGLEQRVIDSLERLRGALQRPDWSGAGALGIQEQNVPYIGEPLPAESESDPRSIVFVEAGRD